MSRDYFEDHDERGDDQKGLAFAPGGSRSAAREAEPRRAEFFRAYRRPVLPIVGLVGAVATVAAFLWLGRNEPEPPAAAPEETPPVASAPGFEAPVPEAPQPESAAAVAALEAPAPGGPEAGRTDPLAPNPSVLGPSTTLPPVAANAAPAGEAAPGLMASEGDHPAAAAPAAARAPAHAARKGAAAPHGAYSVQLLAARSESQVGGAWQKLRGAHPGLLASLSPSVSATEHAGGGTFYRLRAGPLHDRAAADALCRKLSARNQSCFVVSPGS